MSYIKFININREDGVISSTIRCYVLKGKKLAEYNKFHWNDTNEKKRLIPIDCEGSEFFIRGVGHVKFTEKNCIDIPAYDWRTENFYDYEKRYNAECLFYCLTKGGLYDPDCCVYGKQMEFRSAFCNLEHHQKAVELFKRLNELQRKKLYDYKIYNDDDNEYMRSVKLRGYLFFLDFEMMGISLPATMDTPEDDRKLESLWTRLWRERRNDMSYLDCLNERYFPVCMKDRMRLLYGEEIADLYENIINI